VIPLLVALGFVVGRWWILIVAAIGWPLFLILAGPDLPLDEVPLASGLALANTLVGVALHRLLASVTGRGGSAPRHHARTDIR
jgi:hypothetical protein